ncbi:izumo sperm-egg fusion protein 1 isoform X5 [Vombatus ursinus]|uniref:izumo sperm-egg fusion protein 1 isoform X5 n=1 Tax=Vombatus ursinus TaxID=29139 RepID=UPI000FFCFDC2|nr:izumo sperm-egg fusion protein 1 isoform X5 [Vombatus ursinus]
MGNVVKAAPLQGTRPEEPRSGFPRAVVSSTCMGSLLRSALPLGFVVLALVSSPRRAWGCLLCDPAVVAGLRDLEQNYLPSHMDLDPQALQTLVNRLEETIQQFSDLPVEENVYQGVIDEPTLSKASWTFLKELRRIKDSSLRGLCPNKCAQSVRVMENGDMVLDCELSWHKAAEGLTDYRFYRVWPNGSEILISRSQESTLIKPMVSLEDSGVYRCILGTVREHSPATVITYYVKVDQEEEQSSMTSTSAPRETSNSPLEAGLEAELRPEFKSEQCNDHREVFTHSSQNAARILNITLIGLVAGGVAAVLGSLALTLYCVRRAGVHLGRASK